MRPESECDSAPVHWRPHGCPGVCVLFEGMLTPDTRFGTNEADTAMGTALTKFVVTAARKAVPCQSDVLSLQTQSIELPITGESVALFLENSPQQIEMHNGRIRTNMNVIWISDAQFITVPGELLPDIGFVIMQKMSGWLRAIVSLANGEQPYTAESRRCHG